MGPSALQILESALALSPDERAMIADLLVESLGPIATGSINEDWAATLERRLIEIRSGAVTAIPGDEGLAKVRRAVGR